MLRHSQPRGGARDKLTVAGGDTYIIDVEDRSLRTHLGFQIEHIVRVPKHGLVLLGNGLWFEALGSTGVAWLSRRFSWDGMRHIELAGTYLRGEAYAPEGPAGTWSPFELDLRTGAVSGGTYNGPPM